MQVRVLGPIDAVDDEGTNISLRGHVPTRLLALLVASKGDVLVDDLVVDLWPAGDRPNDPVASLRTYVARLRGHLGAESILTKTGAYSLGDVETDAARFEELVERARRASGSPAVADLWRQAVDLWRGPAFASHADADVVRREANRLEELRAEATEAWFDARLAAGEGRELAADVDAAIEEFPLREGFRAQQMTVLSRAGRQAEALRSFQEFRGDLTEIGLEPSERLVELEGQIAGGEVPRAGARRTLRGYELGDRLGEGAFAIVYEATQASVDRPVAIKQVRRELADQPEFIRQFEAEAHLVARLEHPHIVPLYDYWREPGSAYLVMRYLEGGSLGGRVLDEPLAVDELAKMVTQVASGLDEAHEAGVIHRDVKPANILIDASGNAYLSDFGIAVEEQERLDPEAWLSNGSPAYAPPEQLRREAVGPAADVHALGVSVFEALTGQLPFPGETTMAGLLERQLNDPIPLVRSFQPDLPAAVDTVIQKATAKAPSERHQSAGEFAHALARAAGLDGVDDLVEPEDRNPYKGLQAFDESDAGDFTGRERLVTQLLNTMESHRALLVVGPSGSGKSSVVRAGLIPRLRAGALPGSDRSFVTTMVPGATPFADLASALLRVGVDPPPDLNAELSKDANGLARMIRRLIPEGRDLVLVVDQFEELFTLSSAEDRDGFLTALVVALTEEGSRLRLIATLRADFYDQPLRHPAFAAVINDCTVPVRPLAADELEKVITEPAHSVGARFESGLVAEITADVADQPGALPLLQYALTELFDRRENSVLTRAAYGELGGVTGALARRAEEIYESSPGPEQDTTRRVFGRLVNLGDGTEDTRRRIVRSELGDEAIVQPVLDDFGQARLLAFDRDSATREPTVEVAHEALIREWPRLRSWLAEDRDGLRIHRHLTETASSWDRSGREPGELYRGGRLEAAEEWSQDHGIDLNETESSFLQSGVAQREGEAEAERKSTRRLHRLLVGVGVVAVVALIAGLLAFQQQGEASDNAARAETERISAEAAAQVDDNPQLALLLAAEAHNRDPGPAGLGALQQVLSGTENFLGFIQADRSYHYVGWLDDDRLLAAGESGIDVFSMETGEQVLEVDESVLRLRADRGQSQPQDWPASAINSTHGVFVLERAPCCISFIDLASGEVVTSDVQLAIDPAARSGTLFIDVHPTEPLAVVMDLSGTLRMFDMTSGELVWTTHAYPEQVSADFAVPDDFDGSLLLPGSGLVTSVYPTAADPRLARFTPDGSEIVTTGGVTRWWKADDGSPSRDESVRFWCSAPGNVVSVGNCESDGEQAVWLFSPIDVLFTEDSSVVEVTTQSLLIEGEVSRMPTTGAFLGLPKVQSAQAIDENVFLIQFANRRMGIFDVELGTLVSEFDIPVADHGLASLSPDGKTVAIPSPTGIGLWSLDGQRLIAASYPRNGALNGSVDSLATTITGSDANFYWGSSYQTDPFLIDTATGEVTLANLERPEHVMEFSDGSDAVLVTYGLDNSARTYDATNRELLTDFPVFSFTGASVSHDAKMQAFSSPGSDVLVFGDQAELIATLDTGGQLMSSMDFSPDSRYLVASSQEGFFHVWETAGWGLVNDGATVTSPVQAVSFTPDSSAIVTLSVDGAISVIDAESFETLSRLVGTREGSFLNSVMAFSDDGRYLVAGGGESVRLVDLEVGSQIGDTFPNDADFRFGISDGPRLLTAIDDHMLLWNLELDEWFGIACQAAGRNMTVDEWEQFGPTGEEYRVTCPQWPSLG